MDAGEKVGVPPPQQRMRVQQLWQWLYVRGVQSFGAITSMSKELRAELDRHFTLARPEVVAEQISADGTRKWLLRLPGETSERPHEVECVYIPETDRGSTFTTRCSPHARRVTKVTLYTRGFSRFVTSTTAPIATGRSESCRVGLSPTGKSRLSTAHVQVGRGSYTNVRPPSPGRPAGVCGPTTAATVARP